MNDIFNELLEKIDDIGLNLMEIQLALKLSKRASSLDKI